MRRLGVILFSLAYWPVSFAIMLVGAVLSMALLVIGVPYQRVHLWVTSPWFGFCVPLSITRVRIHHHPEYDPERRAVYTQNHINLLDGQLAASVIPHAFSGLFHAWQFKIPIYGWLMWLSKGIGVRRGNREQTIQQISEAAAERRRIGMSVLAFPEGHRTKTGQIRDKFRLGVFEMARNAQMPIVPVTVKGMYEVNRKGSFLFFPGRVVDVYVGPQFETSSISDDELPEFSEEVRQFMLHCFDHGTWPKTAQSARPGSSRERDEQRSCMA